MNRTVSVFERIFRRKPLILKPGEKRKVRWLGHDWEVEIVKRIAHPEPMDSEYEVLLGGDTHVTFWAHELGAI